MNHVSIIKDVLATILVLVAFGCTTASATVAEGRSGIEVELVNDTGFDLALFKLSPTGGTFLTSPPANLLRNQTRGVEFASSGPPGGPRGFELTYMIEESGVFFEVTFHTDEQPDTTGGDNVYVTQLGGRGSGDFSIVTDPPFDPSLSFQKLRTTFHLRGEGTGILILLCNATDSSMNLQSQDLEWGKWTTQPPSHIDKRGYTFIEAKGRSGSASGAEGQFEYSVNDANRPALKVSFDAPYWGDGFFFADIVGEGGDNYKRTVIGYDKKKFFNSVRVKLCPKSGCESTRLPLCDYN